MCAFVCEVGEILQVLLSTECIITVNSRTAQTTICTTSSTGRPHPLHYLVPPFSTSTTTHTPQSVFRPAGGFFFLLDLGLQQQLLALALCGGGLDFLSAQLFAAVV